MDNLKGNIGYIDSIDIGELKDSIESSPLRVGQYLIIGSHAGGTYKQNLIGFCTMSSYNNVTQDIWIDVEPIAPYMTEASADNSYRLQFNPYRRTLRNVTKNVKFYRAIYLGS